MSKLSELLNPTPNSKASEAALESQHPLSHDDAQSNHGDEQPPTMLSNGQIGSPTQLTSLESPLEALATAATSSAPMRSPTQPSGTSFSSFGAPFQSHTSSHPTSSRISPPLPLELSRPPENSIGAYSPGLEQYHHSTSREVKARRLSDNADDASRTLPPLRSVVDENSQIGITLPNGLVQDGVEDWSHGDEVMEPVPVSPVEPQVNSEQSKFHPLDTELTPSTQPPELPQPVPQTLPQSLPADHVTETDPSEVEVKAESVEHPSELLQATIQHGEVNSSTRASAQPSETAMEPALSRSMAELKAGASRQPSLATEAATRSASTNPKPVPSRKRAAPKSKVGKKGTASAVKPAAKKRRLDVSSANATPSGQRSGTPASSRASKTPAPRNRKQQSVTPVRSSSIGATNDEEGEGEEEAEEEDEDEDTELFCICRKPDDHTWMIACDGPCQDWFHGRCVGMDEKDGNLIDKYICASQFLEIIGMG